MEKLTRKESIAIATIHDVIREFRIKGRHVNVSMYETSICISVYADTKEDAMVLKQILNCFKDIGDTIDVHRYPGSDELGPFYGVKLIKRMV